MCFRIEETMRKNYATDCGCESWSKVSNGLGDSNVLHNEDTGTPGHTTGYNEPESVQKMAMRLWLQPVPEDSVLELEEM